MMGWRSKLIGEEWDAFTRWRKWLIYMGRPGVVARIKRAHNKRERRLAKERIREQG